MQEYQNMKPFLKKDTLKIVLMKFWILKKSKTLMEKKFLAKKIYKKELQEKNQKQFDSKKQ